MTLLDTLALFAIMITLAATPSSSVALVVARSSWLGLGNGIMTSAGIVVGDLVFVFMAAYGLTVLSEQMGMFFTVIKFMAAAYLIWLGLGLITSRSPGTGDPQPGAKGGLMTSFISGLVLTLGDVKAIFFYASLLPTFVDMSTLGQTDISIIALITIVSVGGVKIGYAMVAARLTRISPGMPRGRMIKRLAGGLMIGAGGYLMIKA